MKNDVYVFKSRLARTLMYGIITQITLAIGVFLKDVSKMQFLLIVVSVFLVTRFLKFPSITQELLQTMAINTGFEMCIGKEKSLTLLSLFAVFMVGSSFNEETVSSAAQYLFALQVVNTLKINNVIGVVTAIAFYVQARHMEKYVRIKDTILLIVMLVIQQWILSEIPEQGKVPCLFIMLYTLYPFLTMTPDAMNTYNFVILRTSSSLSIAGVSYWTQSVVFGIVWVLRIDEISETVALMVTARLLQMAFVDYMVSIARTDSFFVYSTMIIILQLIA